VAALGALSFQVALQSVVPGASIGRVAITSWGAGQSIVFKVTYRIFFKEERLGVLIGLHVPSPRTQSLQARITQRRRVRGDGAEKLKNRRLQHPVVPVLPNFAGAEGFAALQGTEKRYPFYFDFVTGVAYGRIGASNYSGRCTCS
jgi:hypothetical protein